jgi:hypothetical protein
VELCCGTSSASCHSAQLLSFCFVCPAVGTYRVRLHCVASHMLPVGSAVVLLGGLHLLTLACSSEVSSSAFGSSKHSTSSGTFVVQWGLGDRSSKGSVRVRTYLDRAPLSTCLSGHFHHTGAVGPLLSAVWQYCTGAVCGPGITWRPHILVRHTCLLWWCVFGCRLSLCALRAVAS